MFNQHDFDKIDRTYFDVLQISGYHIILKSKNTKHIWDLYFKETQIGKSSIIISHKHNDTDPFHEQAQMHPKSVDEAQLLIKDHDRWHIQNR